MFVYRLYCHIMAKADFPSEPCASVLLMQSYICSKVDASSLSLRPLYAGCVIPNLKIIFAAVLCSFSTELNSSLLLQHPQKGNP